MVIVYPTLVGTKELISSEYTNGGEGKVLKIDSPRSEDEIDSIEYVDPSWFGSPVEPITTSGGTASFFKLTMTEKGVKELERQRGTKVDQNYWIGKDLSHAEDEKDFYSDIIRLRSKRNEEREKTVDDISTVDVTEGVGLLEDFMFDYLGILRTKTTNASGEQEPYLNLLVMANLRNNCNKFRMLDLKIGVRTACGGWKGKSHLRAMKHYFMDGLTNSVVEGYCLCGFNGVPKVIDSMDPLLDILAEEDIKSGAFTKETTRRESLFQLMLKRQSLEELYVESSDVTRRPRMSIISAKSAFADQKAQVKAVWDEQIKTGKMKEYVKTTWGTKINKANLEKAEDIMFKKMCGTNAFRHFYDFRSNRRRDVDMNIYSPTEVAGIISYEIMSQLIALSTACHKVKIPQKWIGSSVAVSADADFFPSRSSEAAEAGIRSKVTCKIFDWGRSELLTDAKYENLSYHGRADRDRYWNMYKKGIDRLSYNATRFYYHHFTTRAKWTDVTLHVMDFDSMSSDSHIGKVVIPLPDVSNIEAIGNLGESRTYKVKSVLASSFGSTLTCSIRWVEYPADSRFAGVWRVGIERANDLPPMDVMHFIISSDPYVLVTANSSTGQQFHQQTCIKARNQDPVWKEIIDIPVCRLSNEKSLQTAFEASGLSSINEDIMSDFFKWDRNNPDRDNMKWWKKAMQGRDISRYQESKKKWKSSFPPSLQPFQTGKMSKFCDESSTQKTANIFNRGNTRVQNENTTKRRWQNPSKQQGKLHLLGEN